VPNLKLSLARATKKSLLLSSSRPGTNGAGRGGLGADEGAVGVAVEAHPQAFDAGGQVVGGAPKSLKVHGRAFT
jgi:hypothetical protein